MLEHRTCYHKLHCSVLDHLLQQTNERQDYLDKQHAPWSVAGKQTTAACQREVLLQYVDFKTDCSRTSTSRWRILAHSTSHGAYEVRLEGGWQCLQACHLA